MTVRPAGAQPHAPPLDRRNLPSRRSTWGSFGVAIVLHVAVLLVAAYGVTRRSPQDLFQGGVRPEDAVELVWDLAEVAMPQEQAPVEEEEEEDELPQARPLGPPPQVELVQPSYGERGVPGITIPSLTGPGRPGETPAQRLQPALRDGQIWAPLPPEFDRLTPAQREELLIAGRLGAWNDSVAAVAASAAAWRDWTITDGDGDRWGVADGQLYLGDMVIPFPMTFSGSSADREYMREFAELQRQGANALVQQSVRERMEAIRARRDRERAAAQQRTDSAGTTPR